MAAILQLKRGGSTPTLLESEPFFNTEDDRLEIGEGSKVIVISKMNEQNKGSFEVQNGITSTTLNVSATSTLSTVNVSTSLNVTAPLTVTGNSQLTGLVTINGDTSVTGLSTFTGDMSIVGDVTNSGSVDTLGLKVDTQDDTEFLALGNQVEFDFDEMDFTGDLTVTGTTTFNGTVNVDGLGDISDFSSSVHDDFNDVDTELTTLSGSIYTVDSELTTLSGSVHDDFQDVDTTITNLSSSVSDDLDNKENILSLDSKTTSFTLSQTDGTFIECNNGTDIIVTIPDNTTEPFRIGYIVTFWQNDVGGIEVVGDTGVTLNGNPNTDGQYSGIQAIKADTNRWNLLGGVE